MTVITICYTNEDWALELDAVFPDPFVVLLRADVNEKNAAQTHPESGLPLMPDRSMKLDSAHSKAGTVRSDAAQVNWWQD